MFEPLPWSPDRAFRITCLHPDATTPEYATAEAAGMDLCAVENGIIMPGRRALVRTGIAIELPCGYEGQVRPRSGLAFKHGVTVLNAPGTIDSDYRGEIRIILYNTGESPFRFQHRDRIAQLVIAPVSRVSFEEVSGSLSETKRGEGGFGHTGMKAVS